MEKKNWLLLLICIIAGFSWYVYFIVRLRNHYEIEFWNAYSSSNYGKDLEVALREIKSDMRKDGYDGQQIDRIRNTGAEMAWESRHRV